MTESFNRKVERLVRKRASHLCVGLDPDIEKLRESMWEVIAQNLQEMLSQAATLGADLPAGALPDAGTVLEHSPDTAKLLACALAFEATFDYAAAFKPNAAFFELEETVFGSERPEDSEEVIVILDAKRGDIGNSSAQYAAAILGRADYDAVTVNPLMGYDSVEPFLRNPERGAFLLCLTSNPGAEDFLLKNDLYKRIAEKAVEWNREANVGLVVGATRAEYAAEVRAIAPELPLLIPGVGAQGGSLSEIMEAIDARNNPRFLVNASRSILFPKRVPGEEYLDAVARAARGLRDEMNKLLA